MDRRLIEQFEACGRRLRPAVAGLSPEDLTARPAQSDWSILELVIHSTDSDSIAIDRMKRMLIEDDPPLFYADETGYVAWVPILVGYRMTKNPGGLPDHMNQDGLQSCL